MPEPDNSQLLTAIRDGDQQAWQQLIDLYEGRLIAFVDKRLRNRAVSEDLVQETFLGFLISLPNYDERTPLESWLFSIAGHKLTDHFSQDGATSFGSICRDRIAARHRSHTRTRTTGIEPVSQWREKVG